MADERPIVFVVDDDPSMREAVQDLIASVGLEAAGSLHLGNFSRRSRPDAPACLVLDVRLPGSSGFNFQQELVQAGVLIPVIFITGHGDIPMSVRAIKAGAVEFLTKPFHDQELLDAINAGDRAQPCAAPGGRRSWLTCGNALPRSRRASARSWRS